MDNSTTDKAALDADAAASLEPALQNLTLSGDQSPTLPVPSLCSCGVPAASLEEIRLILSDGPEEEQSIRDALCMQTKELYEKYAAEEHPKDVVKQRQLVQQMQEEYFRHYVSHVYRDQLVSQQNQREQLVASREESESFAFPPATDSVDLAQTQDAVDASPTPLPSFLLTPATIWTRDGVDVFKKEMWKSQRECCIKIGSLSTASVRVPTVADGTAVFWEFATDSYDLGFGLYFEWDLEPQQDITVNISESSDEEDEDEAEGGASRSAESARLADDPETGDATGGSSPTGSRHSDSGLPTDELIPVYRRDCHLKVYCGQHRYPGSGVYIFKFDNSFSLWRSKWLYYRIYYSR